MPAITDATVGHELPEKKGAWGTPGHNAVTQGMAGTAGIRRDLWWYTMVHRKEHSMIRWFLFETRVGDLVLYLFEDLTKLAIVDQKYLNDLRLAVAFDESEE